MSEQWKEVPGYEGVYEASDQGRVRRVLSRGRARKGTVLKPFPTQWGYYLVHLRNNGNDRVMAVHRIIAPLFLGQVPADHEVNHIDGNKANNAVSNLEYVTRSENLRHAYATGLRKAAQRKLTLEDAAEVRRMYARGEKQKAIAARFGVDPSTVSRLVSGHRYKEN